MTDSTGLHAEIADLQVQLTYAQRQLEELNDVVTDQSRAIQTLERRVAMLMQYAAQKQAENSTGTIPADQKPPHW